MLRVGLTGGLGSGKSTVARLFAELGVHIIQADEVGRSLMQPGQQVYQDIVEHFGPAVVRSDGTLDRRALAALAFEHGRREELNHLVHPPVIAAQEEMMREIAVADPHAIVIIESALVFEASGSVPGWRERFDKLILVTAPEETKVVRYVARVATEQGSEVDREALARDARARLASQLPDSEKVALCDFVIDTSGTMDDTARQVREIYSRLRSIEGGS